MEEENTRNQEISDSVRTLEKDANTFMEKEGKRTEGEVKNFEKEIEERKKKLLDAFRKGKAWIIYPLLAVIVWISVYIRTRNLPGLKDITTNSWTLGPDLDPFLFLRYAKYIAEHGSFMSLDMMRYVPLGYNTALETKLLPYMIAYLYKLTSIFKPVSIEYAAVMFPVIAFALTTVVFFFFVRELFQEKVYNGTIALVSTALFAVSPSLLSRTIAGIPEKESSILFLFAAFYFFLLAWRQNSLQKAIFFGLLAGIMSGLMGLIWGAIVYLVIPIGISVFLMFMLGKINPSKSIMYLIWLVSFNALLILFSERYSLMSLATSPFSAIIYLNLVMMGVQFSILQIPFTRSLYQKYAPKIPLSLFSLGIAILLSLLTAFFLLGPQGITDRMESFVTSFTRPIQSRFGLTVAENRQPYFDEWKGSFGPEFKKIPLFFWLFFIGSIMLFYHMLEHIDFRVRAILTCLYALMLFGVIFSRYDPSSTFNGVNFESRMAYFGSIILFLVFAVSYFVSDYQKKAGQFMKISYPHLFLFSFFFVALAGARSSVRLIMMLFPAASILIGFFSVFIFMTSRAISEEKKRTFFLVIAAVVILATAYTFYASYQVSKSSAQGFVPSSYTYQWQKAMSWVRENTPKDAVFAHWWDYGYWIQSIGERATVLDGGNAIVYWDHLMGRHVLTGTSNEEALEFLFTHKTTHLLIDSTDIGKYGAYASIGGDENNDRASFIPTLLKNDQQTFETKNEVVYVYPSGFGLDEDIVWENNGSKQVFSSGAAGIGGVFIKIEKSNASLKQPEVVLFDQLKNTQTRIPLKFLFYNDTLTTFDSGIDAGVMIVPRLLQQGNGVTVDQFGAALYFSKRTIHSRMVRLFLFGEKNEAFSLMHSEPSLLIENLRQQGLDIGDFVFFGDIIGPIKIWKIQYPENIRENSEWLKTDFPNEALYKV